MPIKMKYGRVGCIKITIPSFINLAGSKVKVEVSDVLLCLETKPVSQWSDQVIVQEYQDAKRATLDSYENDYVKLVHH